MIFMSALTVYALFFDDIRIIALNKDTDDITNIVTVIVFVIFSVDIGLSCISFDDYVFSFFFWLDLVSTISLLADITWLFEDLTSETALTQATTLAKASRAARITRMIRIVRLIRLARMVKLYK